MSATTHTTSPRLTLLAGILLAGVTLGIYYQTRHHDFVSFDDHHYVTEVRPVVEGITPKNLLWLFEYDMVNCPHPLTYFSLMLDSSLYGASAAGYILTNVLIHCSSTILLFMVLQSATGNFLASFTVSAVFGWHPMRAESVAWISERKDVLSIFFAILTIAGYLYWKRTRKPFQYPLLVLIPYALALLSKPSVVVLPAVLMLLDLWPLRLIPAQAPTSFWSWIGALVRETVRNLPEKIPLFIAAGIFAALTSALSNAYQITWSWSVLPLWDRLQLMVHAYTRYLEKFFLPLNLTALHMHPEVAPPVWETLPYALLLGLLSTLVFMRCRRQPAIFVGWVWFVGCMLPVSGIFQNGGQLTADRYTYLPYIGLAIAVSYGVIFASPDSKKQIVRSITVAVWLGWLAWLSATQAIPAWRSSLALWSNALKENPWNPRPLKAVAAHLGQLEYYGAALVYAEQGVKAAESLIRLRDTALSGPSSLEEVRKVYARLLSLTGQGAKAEALFKRHPLLLKDPTTALLRALYLAADGHLPQAEMTLRLHKKDSSLRACRATLLREMGQVEAAKKEFDELLKTNPDDPYTQIQAAVTRAELTASREFDELATQLQKVIARNPAAKIQVAARIALAYLAAKQGNFEEAQKILKPVYTLADFVHLQAELEKWLADSRRDGAVRIPEVLNLKRQFVNNTFSTAPARFLMPQLLP